MKDCQNNHIYKIWMVFNQLGQGSFSNIPPQKKLMEFNNTMNEPWAQSFSVD